MKKHFLWAVLSVILVPYAGTLGWTGIVRAKELPYESQKSTEGKKRILLDRGGSSYYMEVEEYLPGVLARQIPVEYEPEALKAQAIIARTYIFRQMEDTSKEEIAEASLDMDYIEEEQLKNLWGTNSFPGYYQKLEQSVKETEGLVMAYEGELIDALFCRASAGATRKGDDSHPYLEPVECRQDEKAPGFTEITEFTGEKGALLINAIPVKDAGERKVKAEDFPENVQIISRDEAGYVEEVQIGGFLFEGEEIQYALGLPSACFSIEPSRTGFRVISRGIGHGYGLSQYTANEKAKEGWKAEDILRYFYKNITLISE